MELDGVGWSWVEVDGAGWNWVHDLVIPSIENAFDLLFFS